jgi:vacuolar-type H+-ATPase subunit F/Vma7
MGTLAVIGEQTRVRGFALAGGVVFVAEDAEAVRAAWRSLPDGTDVAILTPMAAVTLEKETLQPGAPLIAVLPEVSHEVA